MFERRLKVFLTVIIVLAALMIFRAIQLQMVQRARWQAKAEEAMRRWTTVDTPRGRILDRKGLRVLAYDEACIDAAVDYRAISGDPDWIKAQAIKRIPTRNETAASGQSRDQLLTDEIERVKSDIDRMWGRVGRCIREDSGRNRRDPRRDQTPRDALAAERLVQAVRP